MLNANALGQPEEERSNIMRLTELTGRIPLAFYTVAVDWVSYANAISRYLGVYVTGRELPPQDQTRLHDRLYRSPLTIGGVISSYREPAAAITENPNISDPCPIPTDVTEAIVSSDTVNYV